MCIDTWQNEFDRRFFVVECVIGSRTSANESFSASLLKDEQREPVLILANWNIFGKERNKT